MFSPLHNNDVSWNVSFFYFFIVFLFFSVCAKCYPMVGGPGSSRGATVAVNGVLSTPCIKIYSGYSLKSSKRTGVSYDRNNAELAE